MACSAIPSPRSFSRSGSDRRRELAGWPVELWPAYLAYAVTFLFIGQVWANHHVMFDHIRAADRVVLLAEHPAADAVAFLPFATSVLAEALRSGHDERTAVVFYGIAFAATALTFNAVWQYARRHRLLSATLPARQPSAGAFNAHWPGSWPAPCLAPRYPSWAWPRSPRSTPSTGS